MLVGDEHVAKLLPVHQVAADGVAPVHVAPFPAVRIVLVEQVILAVVEDEAVGVVVPAASRREVELRAEPLAVEIVGALDRVALLDRIERVRILGQLVHLKRHRLARQAPTSRNAHQSGLVVGQLDVVAHARFGRPRTA